MFCLATLISDDEDGMIHLNAELVLCCPVQWLCTFFCFSPQVMRDRTWRWSFSGFYSFQYSTGTCKRKEFTVRTLLRKCDYIKLRLGFVFSWVSLASQHVTSSCRSSWWVFPAWQDCASHVFSTFIALNIPTLPDEMCNACCNFKDDRLK